MNLKKYCIVTLVFFIIAGCENRSVMFAPEDVGGNQTYPSIYSPLPQERIDKLLQDFKTLNPDMNNAEFDEFGFFRMTHGLPDDESVLPWTEDEAIQMAKEYIIKNKYYVHMQNENNLVFFSIRQLRKRWIIKFQQYEKDIPVYNNYLYIYIDHEGITSINGGFYADLVIPDSHPYSRQEIENALIGYEFIYYCWTPIKVIIDRKMIGTHEELVLYPKWVENKRMVHLAWVIPLIQNGETYYLAFVDAVTYEVLTIEALFIC